MKHWHTAKGTDVDYTVTFTTFAWALARCSTLMSLDQELRHPYTCVGDAACQSKPVRKSQEVETYAC